MSITTVTEPGERIAPPAPIAPAGPPAAAPLLILGTPFAAWLPLAGAVKRAVDSAARQGEFAVRVDPDGDWPPAPPAPGGPDPRCLILFDSPRRALAHWLTYSMDGTLEDALRRWCEGARRLLRHAHSLRGRCVLVDAHEAAANPALLAATLAGWLGLSIDDDADWTTPLVGDPLADLLADEPVRGDREANRLHAELLASCVAWDDDTAPPGGKAEPEPERTALLKRYRELQALAQAQRPLAEERAELLVKLHHTQDTLRSVHGQEQAARQELARAYEQLQALATQRDDLALQLEGERAHLAAERAARAVDAEAGAEVQRNLEAARQDTGLLINQIRQVEQELEGRMTRVADLQRQLGEAVAARDALAQQAADQGGQLAAELAARVREAEAGANVQRELAAARQEGELLLAQLHQVQEELETWFLRERNTQRLLAEAAAERDRMAARHDDLAGQLTAERESAAARQEEIAKLLAAERAARAEEDKRSTARRQQDRQQLQTQAQLTQDAQDRLAAIAAERDSLAHRLTEANARFQQELLATRREGELLLAQLHQMQEKLETSALREKNRDRQLAEATAERDRMAARRDDLVDQLTAERESAAARQEETAKLLALERAARAEADERSTARLQQQRQQLQAQAQLAQDAQERLAAMAAERDSLAQRLAAVTAQQYALAAQCQSLESMLAEQQAQNDTLSAEAARTATERDSLQVQARGLKLALGESDQRVELLVRDLQQESIDSERLALEVFQLRQAASFAAASAVNSAAVSPALSQARAASIRVTQVRDEPPYRHLDVQIDDFHVASRQVPALAVRLVEHLGRPGLVVFGSGDAETALSAWVPSGDEEGRPYLLLVPSDAPGQRRLEGMGRADWLTVAGIAALVQDAVSDTADTMPGHWPVVAARLVRQLQALPPRLRYDTLETVRATVPGDSAGPCFDVLFGGVLFGTQELARLHLVWRPRSGRETPVLEWLLDAHAAEPPLAGWPVNEGGSLQPALALPVGPGLTRAQRRNWWARWAAADQAMVLAVLDALPAAARRLPEEALPAGLSHDDLAAHAERSHRDARRALMSLQLRQSAGSVVRHLRLAN